MSDFSNFLDIQTKTAWGRNLAEFASFCNPRPASVILDVGCGPGLLPALFAQRGCQSFGVDLDYRLLVTGLIPNLVQADALKLPYRPATFDMVSATNLLFLLTDPLQALQEWQHILKPGGSLCLLNPSENLSTEVAERLVNERGLEGTGRESLLAWARNAETHFRWTENEIQDLLERTGFHMDESVVKVGPGLARFVRARLH